VQVLTDHGMVVDAGSVLLQQYALGVLMLDSTIHLLSTLGDSFMCHSNPRYSVHMCCKYISSTWRSCDQRPSCLPSQTGTTRLVGQAVNSSCEFYPGSCTESLGCLVGWHVVLLGGVTESIFQWHRFGVAH
jgi:hypothetical protein